MVNHPKPELLAPRIGLMVFTFDMVQIVSEGGFANGADIVSAVRNWHRVLELLTLLL